MGPLREINGPRPSRLKIHKDSHPIHKPSSSSSSSSMINQQPRREPVIIYTHSPKVIHTHARDFMALVQKLTGLSHSDDDEATRDIGDNKVVATTVHDEDSSSSENCGVGDVKVNGCQFMAPVVLDPPPMNPFLSEIPLFTPNSSDFFCSPRNFYRFSDSSMFSPGIPNYMGSSISPSVITDVMNAFPEY